MFCFVILLFPMLYCCPDVEIKMCLHLSLRLRRLYWRLKTIVHPNLKAYKVSTEVSK